MLTMILMVNPDAGVLAKKLTMYENGIVLIPYMITIKTRVPSAPEKKDNLTLKYFERPDTL